MFVTPYDVYTLMGDFAVISELKQKVRKLTTELEIAKAEKESTIAQRINLENKARLLEKDVNENVVKFEGIIREVHVCTYTYHVNHNLFNE